MEDWYKKQAEDIVSIVKEHEIEVDTDKYGRLCASLWWFLFKDKVVEAVAIELANVCNSCEARCNKAVDNCPNRE